MSVFSQIGVDGSFEFVGGIGNVAPPQGRGVHVDNNRLARSCDIASEADAANQKAGKVVSGRADDGSYGTLRDHHAPMRRPSSSASVSELME